MFNILQWNINGFYNNYTELEILIKDISPHFIALQETHLAVNKDAFVPNKYVSYFLNLPQNTTNKQGIAALVRKDIPHKCLHIHSNIASLAVQVSRGF